MKKNKFLKIGFFIVLMIFLQSYLQKNQSFKDVLWGWFQYLKPLIWSFSIALLIEPMVSYFEEKLKIRRIFSLIISIIVIFSVLLSFIFIIVPQLIESIKELNSMYPYIVDKASTIVTKLIDFLQKKRIIDIGRAEIETNILDYLKNNMISIQNFVLSVIMNFVWWTVGISNFLIGFLLASLIVFDKEYYVGLMKNISLIIFGKSRGEKFFEFLSKSRLIFLDYFIGRLIVSIAIGIVIFLFMFLTKTPYAALTGTMFIIGNMIPVIGSLAAGIVSFFLVLVVAPQKIVFLLLGIFLAQALDSFIIGPKVVGDKLGLNVYWVTISIIIFGNFFGMIGMFLGVPILCMIRLLYKESLVKIGD